MKQTAVEWLQQALEDTILTHEQIMQTIGLFEQAKEMEKEQHKQTWLDSTAQFDNAAEMTYKKDFEQYYNETEMKPSIRLRLSGGTFK
jgi:hypothetical protein